MKFKYLIISTVFALLDYPFAEVLCLNRVKYDYAQENRNELPRQTIRPRVQHGIHKHSIEHTLEENGLHANDIILTYRHNDVDVVIDLQLNDNLISDGHFISYQTKDGGKIVKTFNKTEVDMCHYHGTVRGNNNSQVALSTCNGINGIVIDEHNTYHIQPGLYHKLNSEHFFYKQMQTNVYSRCGNVDRSGKNVFTDYNSGQPIFNSNSKLRYKREAYPSVSSLRTPYNSNKDSLYVELVVVVDNGMYRSLKKDLRKVHDYVKDLVNIVNTFYVPLNIFIALTGVVVWTEQDQIQINDDAEETLHNFVKYREQSLINDHPNDNAHLLLNKQFLKRVVGIAFEGLMCTSTYSGGLTTIHSEKIGAVATTMAHEIGHNFGLEHDDPKYCKCIERACLMVSSTSTYSPKQWSSCSLEQFSISFYRGINVCLKNKPKNLFESSTCGNGFVEPGEQCDCGLPEHCKNACCNSKTCTLRSNATCATGKCCDLTMCQLKIAGYECRKANGDCDLSEYCSGQSEYCPNDVFKRDTEICGLGQAYCYKGKCQSHLDRCKLLWGPSGKPAYQCFKQNTNASKISNCGFNKKTQKFIACQEQDVYCGLLHCRRLSEKPQYGLQPQDFSYQFMHDATTNDSVINCAKIILNVRQQSTDPSLTPDGAKCGEDKMCLNQKCLSIEILREDGIGSACQENCNGNGVCNSKGHCHCSSGYAPPTCKQFGNGGSIDSGPIRNNQAARVSYALIFGIVIIITATIVGIIYWRKNKSIPTPSELVRKVSTAPKEMIEIIRRVSIAPRDIVRRVSIAPREIARRVSNVFNSASTIQNARSRLRRTDGPHGLYNSRELILDVDNLQEIDGCR